MQMLKMESLDLKLRNMRIKLNQSFQMMAKYKCIMEAASASSSQITLDQVRSLSGRMYHSFKHVFEQRLVVEHQYWFSSLHQ